MGRRGSRNAAHLKIRLVAFKVTTLSRLGDEGQVSFTEVPQKT